MTIAEEINYLSALSGVPCSDFKHVLVEKLSQISQTPSGPIVENVLIDFFVPDAYGWLVTKIFIRGAITPTAPIDEATLRSDDIYYPFNTRLFIRRNGNPIFKDIAEEHLISNKPVLIPFSNGDRFELVLFNPLRIESNVSAVAHGYFVPPSTISIFQRWATVFISLDS